MLKIYGVSDDLIEIEGDNGYAKEVNAYADDYVIIVGSSSSGGVVLSPKYGRNGCWGCSIELISEDVKIPWDIYVEHSDYSVVVKIDCPSDVPVRIKKKQDNDYE